MHVLLGQLLFAFGAIGVTITILASFLGWVWRRTGMEKPRLLGPSLWRGVLNTAGAVQLTRRTADSNAMYEMLPAHDDEVILCRRARVLGVYVGTPLPLLVRLFRDKEAIRWELRTTLTVFSFWCSLLVASAGGHLKGSQPTSAFHGTLATLAPVGLLISFVAEAFLAWRHAAGVAA